MWGLYGIYQWRNRFLTPCKSRPQQLSNEPKNIQNGQKLTEISIKQCIFLFYWYLGQFLFVLDVPRLVRKLLRPAFPHKRRVFCAAFLIIRLKNIYSCWGPCFWNRKETIASPRHANAGEFFEYISLTTHRYSPRVLVTAAVTLGSVQCIGNCDPDPWVFVTHEFSHELLVLICK